MAFIQANIYSNVLEMEVNLNVILPQTTKKVIGTSSEQETTDIPVLYLLHGMGGNHSVWERRTSIERYVADYGLAVIMPSTDLGWYTDTVYDMKYWTFIAEELPEICHELFPQLTRKREKTYAAGLSMGGYGALKLGLAKSENFAAVISLSGAVSVGNRMDDLLFMIEEYERRYDEHQGLLLGSVTTAVPLSDEQRIQLEKNVAKTMNYQSVELKQIVDSSIIGGAIVEANHRVIDGSIRTQLENMRNQLNR